MPECPSSDQLLALTQACQMSALDCLARARLACITACARPPTCVCLIPEGPEGTGSTFEEVDAAYSVKCLCPSLPAF